MNLQFLSPAAFQSPSLAAGLLLAHLSLLLLFAHFRWLRRHGGLPQLLRGACGRLRLPRCAPPRLRQLDASEAASMLLEANFIGVACARSLHFQFYAWYALSLPLLLWRTRLPVPLRLLLLLLVERCWNVYPPTREASLALQACHAALLIALLAAPFEDKGRRRRSKLE